MRIVVAILIVLLAVPALAQPPSAPPGQQSPPRLEPVVVEGVRVPADRTRTDQEATEELSRVPGGTAVIDQKAIDQTRGANLRDVLDFVPGVMIRPRFGAADESQLSIRGSGLRNNFHLRGINILIDGFIYGQADGFSDFEALELWTTKRIEVYKGANALEYGGYTLGGAINLVSKTGYDAGLIELRSEAGSFGFLKNYIGTGQVYGPFDLYVAFTDTELDGYRDHSEQVRRRAFGTFGYRFSGGTTIRLDLAYTHSEEELPGALTLQEFLSNPRQQDPTVAQFRQERNYDYGRGGLTLRTPLGQTQALEWKTQLDYQDIDHPLSFAVIDQVTWNWGTELRYTAAAPLFSHGNRFIAGLQYFSTRQNDLNFQNLNGHRGALTKEQINVSTNVGAYAEDWFDIVPTFTAVVGARAQWAIREVRDQFLSNGNQSDSVDFFSFNPKLGFLWRVVPTIQVFGNASRSSEPPLILELTAPGQIGGDLSQLNEQTAWQFEVGTRGTSVGQPRDLGRRRVRHRAVGRDHQHERPAVPRRAVHDPALHQHRSLAALGCGIRRQRRARPRRGQEHGSGRPRRCAWPRGSPTPIRASSTSTIRSSTTTTFRALPSTSSGASCATTIFRASGSRRASSGCRSAISSTARTP